MLGVSMIMIKAFLIFPISPLLGVLAICLGIWHERKKEVERRGRGWKYLMFSVIGTLSFLAGFYLGDEMHFGYVILFALIIYALLFSMGLYISRERSLGFGLKVFGISFLFLFLAFHGIMAYGAHEHYYAKAISVHKLSTAIEYLNVTEEDLEEYSILKRGKELADKFADRGKTFKMSQSLDKWLRIEDFLDKKGLRTIEIGGEYYEFELISNLRVQKYYANITKEELEEYPTLKKAIESANRSENSRATLKVHPDEWEEIGLFSVKRALTTSKSAMSIMELGLYVPK